MRGSAVKVQQAAQNPGNNKLSVSQPWTNPGYKPPSVTGADKGPQPKALCPCTFTVQFGTQSTVKLAVSVVPDTVWVNVPAPSLPVIVILYSSTG
ncbi:MAG TPA: hypothetical protein VFC07_09385, partial [Verrucomicrobiae bacterium]|nr:hypothetical protein [Verrucomicrobiae bacterium]